MLSRMPSAGTLPVGRTAAHRCGTCPKSDYQLVTVSWTWLACAPHPPCRATPCPLPPARLCHPLFRRRLVPPRRGRRAARLRAAGHHGRRCVLRGVGGRATLQVPRHGAQVPPCRPGPNHLAYPNPPHPLLSPPLHHACTLADYAVCPPCSARRVRVHPGLGLLLAARARECAGGGAAAAGGGGTGAPGAHAAQPGARVAQVGGGREVAGGGG